MKLTFVAGLFLFSTIAQSQDISFNREIVDTLASSYFWGRGYTNDGMKKAANFLVTEFKILGVQPLNGDDYFQILAMLPIPSRENGSSINGKTLTPGVDFIVCPESRGAKGRGKLEQKDSADFIDFKNRIIVNLQDKLTWSVEQQVADYTLIQIE